MASEETKTAARRYVEGLNSSDLSRVEEFISPDCTFGGPGIPPGLKGPEGYKQIVQTFRRAFPDLQVTVDELIAEGEKVAVRWHATATHQGELFGIGPTNKHGGTTAIHLFMVSDGKVREARIEWDMLGLMQQLGVIPAFGGAERRAA